ncbi:MAG: LemA family protein [Thermodesulfobacteriota bacterium]
MNGALAVLAAVAGISVYPVVLYNRLVKLRNLSRSSWSDIDVLLKKRHDLVGNLVETVKGYAGYEKSVLQGVTEARARAMLAEGPAGKGKEEAALREALPSLFAVAESYPDLKASGGYLELQKQLAEIENGIEYARRYYNAVVRDYSTAMETFPANLFARPFGFRPAEYFQLDAPAERNRTDVRLSCLALLLLAALLPGAARAEDFTIRSFRAAIEVRADASLRIVETIEAEFHRPRHGIFRDIPFRYVDELGKKTVTPVRIDSVKDASGEAWNHRSERSGGVIRVRIGDPDRFVNGRQVYVIAYTVENAILFFPDHDELYWNVTGNGWPVPIEAASAAVTVAAVGKPLAVRTLCYTGPAGSRESACTATGAESGAAFSSTRPFGPGEGLTIVAGWEKGIVRMPSGWKASLYRLDLARYWPFLIPLLAFVYMFSLWYRKGKDPSTGNPLVVAYTPPEANGRPLMPAEIGALIDERLDPRDISASVVDLAVKGYIKIEERKTEGLLLDKTDYALKKAKEPDGGLSSFESLLLDGIFRGRGPEAKVSDLKLSFYKNLEPLRNAAFRELQGMKCFGADPSNVTGRYVLIAFLVLFFGTGVAYAFRVLLGDTFSLVPVATALSGVVILVFAPFMPVKTLKGVKLLGRIKGFEEFLLRAEKDRLERMNDPNLFEKYLPYAIALDVSDRWADAFEEIAQEPPRWYASADGPASFRPAVFHRSLDTALSGISTAMHSAPRSSGSGFSGGGSSGGGGGGGGGGSW